MSYLQGFQVVVSSHPASIQALQNRVAELLDELDYPIRDRFCIRLGLEEALVNALRHGHHGHSERTVLIGCMIDSECARFEIEDNGEGFQVNAVPSPVADENLRKPSGRGLHLMRSFMDKVEFNESGNRLVLQRTRQNDAAHETLQPLRQVTGDGTV